MAGVTRVDAFGESSDDRPPGRRADRTRAESRGERGGERGPAGATRAEGAVVGSGGSGGSAGGEPPTRAEHGGGGVVYLPPALAARFVVRRRLGSGGEADVWLAERTDGRGEVALKVFRTRPRYVYDLGSDEYRAHFPREHAVEVFERGEDAGVWWEVMEYCPLGTLADVNARRTAPFPERFLVDVVREVAAALERMHPVVHGDLKPSNVLIRCREPLDLVLTDFGLTVDLGDRSSRTNVGRGTAAYLAPGAEARTRPAGDWWALGMTVLDLVLGRNVFQHADGSWMDETTIRENLAARPVPLDGVPTGRVRDLIRGLLVRDPDRRWGVEQVREWLAGGAPPIPDDAPSRPAPPPVRGFPFNQRVYTVPAALGAAMRANPDRARALAGGVELQELAEWAAVAAPEAGLAGLVSRSSRYKPDITAAVAAQLLDPAGPILFRGRNISSPEALAQLASSESDREIVTDLYQRRVLAAFAYECEAHDLKFVYERWVDLVERTTELLAASAPLPPGTDEFLALTLLAAAAGSAKSSVMAAAEQAATPLSRETAWFARLCTRTGVDALVRAIAVVLTAPQAESQAREARAEAIEREEAARRQAQQRARDAKRAEIRSEWQRRRGQVERQLAAKPESKSLGVLMTEGGAKPFFGWIAGLGIAFMLVASMLGGLLHWLDGSTAESQDPYMGGAFMLTAVLAVVLIAVRESLVKKRAAERDAITRGLTAAPRCDDPDFVWDGRVGDWVERPGFYR